MVGSEGEEGECWFEVCRLVVGEVVLLKKVFAKVGELVCRRDMPGLCRGSRLWGVVDDRFRGSFSNV